MINLDIEHTTLYGKDKGKDEEIRRKHVERFYILLSSIMNELFEYAPKSGHVKMPYNVSFGLIHDKRDSILLKGTDQKTGKKLYLYNTRIIGKMFEERREQMLKDIDNKHAVRLDSRLVFIIHRSICI